MWLRRKIEKKKSSFFSFWTIILVRILNILLYISIVYISFASRNEIIKKSIYFIKCKIFKKLKIHNLDIYLHDCYNIPNLHFYFYIFHFFLFFARQTQLSPTINFLLIQRLNSEQYFTVNFSRQIHSYVICAYIYIRAFNRIEISIEKHPRFLIFSITTNIWQAVEKKSRRTAN